MLYAHKNVLKINIILQIKPFSLNIFQLTLNEVGFIKQEKHWLKHVHRRNLVHYKFGENVSNTLPDIVLTIFRDAHTDARTHARTNRTEPLCLWPHYIGRRHKNKSHNVYYSTSSRQSCSGTSIVTDVERYQSYRVKWRSHNTVWAEIQEAQLTATHDLGGRLSVGLILPALSATHQPQSNAMS